MSWYSHQYIGVTCHSRYCTVFSSTQSPLRIFFQSLEKTSTSRSPDSSHVLGGPQNTTSPLPPRSQTMASYYPVGGVAHQRVHPLYGYGCFDSYRMPAVPPSYMQGHPFSANNTIGNNFAAYGNGDVSAPAQASHSSEAPAEATGGITAVMEYKPATMASFLSWCVYGMLKQGRAATAEFEQAIVSILHATRLPKSTIIIALEYVNQRFGTSEVKVLADNEVFLTIVVSLVLANKFNDDNTFTNRSWSGATGLQIEMINKEEASWLEAVGWNLNIVPFRANIECLDECWNTWLNRYSNEKMYSSSSAYTSAYAPAYTPSYGSAYTPSSPTYDYGFNQSSISSSPVASSPAKYNYDWQNSQYNWGHGFANMYSQPLIWAHNPASTSQYGSDFASYGYGVPNTYYNCMASC